IDEVDLGALEVIDADRVDEQPDAVRLEHLVASPARLFDHQPVLEPRAAAALHEHAQAAARLAFFSQQFADLRRCHLGYVDHSSIICATSAASKPGRRPLSRCTGEIYQCWPINYTPAVP